MPISTWPHGAAGPPHGSRTVRSTFQNVGSLSGCKVALDRDISRYKASMYRKGWSIDRKFSRPQPQSFLPADLIANSDRANARLATAIELAADNPMVYCRGSCNQIYPANITAERRILLFCCRICRVGDGAAHGEQCPTLGVNQDDHSGVPQEPAATLPPETIPSITTEPHNKATWEEAMDNVLGRDYTTAAEESDSSNDTDEEVIAPAISPAADMEGDLYLIHI